MEGTSKDRITGAVILVAVAALVVPELLSGPGGDSRAGDAADAVAEAGPPLATYELTINPAGNGGAARQQELATSAAREQSEAIAQAVPPPVTAPARPATSEPAAVAQQPAPAARQSLPESTPDPAPASRPVDPPTKAAAPAPAPKQEPAAASKPATATAPKPATTPAAASGKWWVQLGSFSSADNAQRLARELRAKGFTIEVSVVKSNGKDLHRVRAGPEANRDAATALRTRLAAAGQQGTLVAP